MAAEMMKLLGLRISFFSMRVAIALNLKKVQYEFIEEDIFSEKSELLLKSNPVYKKVPVLIHRGKAICESSIIVQYIDEEWTSGPSILSSGPFDRAMARFWATYIDDKLLPLILILRGAAEEPKAEAAEQAAEVLQLLEKAFDKCSAGKNFFGGDNIGYVDIVLGSYLGWIEAVESMNNIKLLDEKTLPLLAGWAERFCNDNAVKEVMLETDKYVAFAKVLNALPAR